ncbi:MAG: sigma 54-interacting transcriptional regulator [Ectothiorhodospiraceae bacterium]|nr:sigma 54-interacting transcriptional regulator [Ectothiorhodospiraceae bacterium]
MTTNRTGPTVLVVDDDRDLLELLRIRLRVAGYRARVAASAREALVSIERERPDLVITDLRMDGMDGLALCDAIAHRFPAMPVIVLTAHGSIPDAVAATHRGAIAFLSKPFDGAELVAAIARGLSVTPTAVRHGDDWRADIVTRSPAMEEVLAQIRMVADRDVSVHLHGPSGSGKELLARAVHRASPRADAAFVAFNCAAIPEALAESELFGHARGAFTGAATDHRGLLASAHRGTLFLDEVGDMPLALQAKLLRALEEHEVRPLGSTRAVPAEVRVVSATHRDLAAEVVAGRFREDLLYRLAVVTLVVPPLERRREDIPPLVARWIAGQSSRARNPIRNIAPQALELLMGARWPGNVRQLFNVLEHAAALSQGPVLTPAAVRRALREEPTEMPSLEEARSRFERDYLGRVLGLAAGNVTRAARLAGRNRTEFYKLLRRHGLDPAVYKSGEAADSESGVVG